MSRDNVDLHRRVIAAFNARDIDALLELFDPDGEYRALMTTAGGAVYRGHAGMRRFLADMDDAWAGEFRVEPSAYFDLGDDTLLTYVARGRGRHSGADVTSTYAQVFRWRDGAAVYGRVYADVGEALRDLQREHVDIVRRVYEAASRRDAEAVLALYDPDVELDGRRLGVVGLGGTEDVYRGHDGLRRFFRDWHEAWDVVDYDYDELIDAGRDQVVSVVTRRGRGRVSGAEVEMRAALLWTVRDGRVARIVWFPSAQEALAAASDDSSNPTRKP